MSKTLFNAEVMKNGMLGLVVGDALGCPVQFMSRREIRNRERGPVVGMEEFGTYDMPIGTWTDDSSLALAALDSIRVVGGIDPADIISRFCKWQFNGAYTPYGKAFDQGLTCIEAIYNFRKTKDPETCGRRGEHANGNGALMRILPVCLYYVEQVQRGCCSDADAIEGIHRVASLTHNHLRSNIACGLYYFMAKALVTLGQDHEENALAADNRNDNSVSNAFLLDCLQKGLDEGFDFYEADVENLAQLAYYGRTCDLEEFVEVPDEKIKSSGYVVDSFEAAVWCLATTDNFKDCLLKAVNLGDDTDTVAAIAGGLAGLYYGVDAFPAEWLEVIVKREWIEELCES